MIVVLARAFVLLLAALAMIMAAHLITRPVSAHNWYPVGCCSGNDCFPIKETDLEAIPNGYRIKSSGLTATGGQVHRSEDGRFHICTIGGKPDDKPRCLFEPPMGF